MSTHDIGQFGKKATLQQRLLSKFPLTYMGIMRNMVGTNFDTILDVGCGTGTPMELIKLDNPNAKATGVDIYKPYIDEAESKEIYDKIIQTEVTNLPFKEKEFDVVVCFHVIEHLEKDKGLELLTNLEKLAKKRVIVAMPVGDFPQDEYDGNEYQVHRSAWYPQDLKSRGYKVVGQGLKAIYRTDNLVLKYGIWTNVIFAVGMLFQPVLFFKPELGTFMLARKDL